MKRFIINIIASHYHYWLRVQKVHYPYIETYGNIALTITFMEMNLDILTGGHILYITLKIGGVTPFTAMLPSVVINYFLLKWIFPVKRVALAERRLNKAKYYIYHTILGILFYANLFFLLYMARLVAKM